MDTNLPTPTAKIEAPSYQHYESSRISMQMITPNGKKIAFTNFAFITLDTDIIEYLDSEIKQGLNLVTKGKRMTHEEADPMESLKRKHIAEYLEKEAEELKQQALGISKDMGNTAQSATKIAPASTKAVAAGKSA